ncbi:MAG: DUF3467 domain-containing protein [Hyphomicrobiales bacterium]|nr:DUF3467 domain-containing protein [Hyphomicrobiales bacterium]
MMAAKKNANTAPAVEETETETEDNGAVPNRVIWDDSDMETAFANVVNVISTREEFALLFGTNQTWNLVDTSELTVRLTNRMVLTPYAAKRFLALLHARMQEYEQRFGELKL